MSMQKMSRLLPLLFLLAFWAAPAASAPGNGRGNGNGNNDCVDPLAAECDPDYDDAVSLIPHNYDFDGVPVGSEALPMSFALVNTSGGEVAVGTLSISGEGINTCMAIGCPVIADGEFFLLSDECSGAILADQGSCELEVGFLPAAAGEYLTGLWIPYTPAGGESQTLRGRLTGAGRVDDGTGFTLSGTIQLFGKPEPGAMRALFADARGETDGTAIPSPKAHTWQPLAGVAVTLDNGAATLTNELGEYRFEGLDQGAYAVTPAADGFRFVPAVRHTRITGRDRLGIEFRARADRNEAPAETQAETLAETPAAAE